MNINPGSSFFQITQGVASRTQPNSGDAANSARPAVRQFAEQLRSAGQVQQAGPTRPATQSHETVEIIEPDAPSVSAPPRNLPRGSFINIRV
jgi:hypothetical protein